MLHHCTRNRETGAQQPAPPPSALGTYELPAQQDLTQVNQRKVEVPSSMAQERKPRKQGADGMFPCNFRVFQLQQDHTPAVKKLNGILRWLRAWNCNEIYERTLLLRQPDTCIWLPSTNTYKRWRDTENSFLWLHGKGRVLEVSRVSLAEVIVLSRSGKICPSVRMCSLSPSDIHPGYSASVINSLKSSLQDGEVLAYFYCDFRNERSTSAAEVMRSLLSQLVQRFHRHAVHPGDLIDELIEERDGGAPAISNVVLLARYISRAAKQFSRQPLLVVDALDECTEVQGLLDALEELRKGGIRLFVTSRPLQIIKDGLSGVMSIDMDTMKYEVSADIKLHVTRVLDSHRRLRIMGASLKNEMYSVLCEKADAM